MTHSSWWRRGCVRMGWLFWRIPTICAVMAAGACAPLNPDSLRTDPGLSRSFDVSYDYETVYSNEQRGFLLCMTGSFDLVPGSASKLTFAIQPRINKQTKVATITYVHHGVWQDIWAVVDMRSTDHGTTVSAYTTSHPIMRDFGQVTEKWTIGLTDCPAQSPVMQQYQLSE